jgi:hypothetical protein
MDMRYGVEREGSFDPTTAGKLYAATGQIAERNGFPAGRKPREPEICAARGKTNAGESASKQNGRGQPLAHVKKRTQVFSFAGLRNTMGREGLSLDGVNARSKVLSYPA